MNLNQYLELDPYCLKSEIKKRYFFSILNQLTIKHYKNSKNYKKLLNVLNYKKVKKIEELPFIPTDILKSLRLIALVKARLLKY